MEPAERLRFVEKLVKDPFASVTRDDLVASIVERGVIEPVNAIDLTCKVKPTNKDATSATTIKWLIDDGSIVKKGDRLALLDDAVLRDQLEVARVKVNQAEAARVEAASAVEIAKFESEVDSRLAEIDVKLAELQLNDPPAGQTKPMLELKVERAKLLYERTRARGKGQLRQAEAAYRARSAALELETRRFKEKETELQQCVLISPIDGIAIYYVPETGRFGGAAAVVAVGEPVREGQKLLRVFDLSKFAVATRVHEAMISSVRNGQTSKVRVDAFPGREVSGKVSQISPVAALSDWRMADVKVYPVTISLDNAPQGLKPGMTAELQITTGERKGVIQVPIKSIATVGRERFCYVKAGDDLVERKVVVGASNSTAAEIREGLKEGERVLADATMIQSTTGGKGPAKQKAK